MSIRFTCTGCGYAGLYRTPALAEFHFARHSCRKERDRQARARRIRARQASRDGVRRDCQHPIARHQHGTRNAYVLDKCRCAPCKTAARDYENQRVRNQLYGRPPRLVDAEPVRAHLRALMTQGTGAKHAATLAGLSATTVSQILYGRPDRRDHRPPYRCDAAIAAAIIAERQRQTIERQRTTRAHGTTRRYTLGCRCTACTAANRTRHYEWALRRRAELGLPPPDNTRGRPRGAWVRPSNVVPAPTCDEQIEQMIAVGRSVTRILTDLNITYEQYRQVREHLDEAAAS